MKWPRPSAPDHPEYGAEALLTTSVGPVVLIAWTERACWVDRVQGDGWTSGRGVFGGLDTLAAALEKLGVPATEAAMLAADVADERRQRWHARESEARWPIFELWFYGAGAVVAVPALTGGVLVVTAFRRMLRRPRS